MIDISKIKTYGWDAAIRGMRNSYGSWEKSDSEWEEESYISPDGTCSIKTGEKIFHLGPNDLELASRLAKLGGSHAKFRRMIIVSMDILAPLYWWKEFDTYKVGTVANSTSTMHSIMKKEFSIDDFSLEEWTSAEAGTHMIATIDMLNHLRKRYLEENEYPQIKRMFWDDVIHMLPSSYNQLRTVMMNYEVVAHIVDDRLNHRLPEWETFCVKLLTELPYAKQLIFEIHEAKDGAK